MSNEVYTVDLAKPTAEGARRLQFHEASGDILSLGDDGVVTIINGREGAVLQINPHAWLTINTENIDMTEEQHD